MDASSLDIGGPSGRGVLAAPEFRDLAALESY